MIYNGNDLKLIRDLALCCPCFSLRVVAGLVYCYFFVPPYKIAALVKGLISLSEPMVFTFKQRSRISVFFRDVLKRHIEMQGKQNPLLSQNKINFPLSII